MVPLHIVLECLDEWAVVGDPSAIESVVDAHEQTLPVPYRWATNVQRLGE
jgi:hypothetical protein